MLDVHGHQLQVGDRVVTIKDDGCIPVGSIGIVRRVTVKKPGWSRIRTYPEHALVADKDGDDFDWSGWFDPDEIAKVNLPEFEVPVNTAEGRGGAR